MFPDSLQDGIATLTFHLLWGIRCSSPPIKCPQRELSESEMADNSSRGRTGRAAAGLALTKCKIRSFFFNFFID